MPLSKDHYRMVLDNLYDGVYLLDEDRNIIYWNDGAEQHTGFRQSEVIGKCCDNVLQHVDGDGVPLCGDSCPVTQTILDGCLREVEVYIQHKEGHRVPVSMRIASIKGTDNEVAVAVEIYNDNSPKYTLHRMVQELKTQALLDPLLELGNRRYLESAIRGRIEELARYGWQFGILFVDIDHFKSINDRYGHEIGDKVLKMLSKSMSNSLRAFDMVGRWGGEEFIVIVVNVGGEQLNAVANRLRMLVEQSSITLCGDTIRATVSIGATLALSADDVDTLIKRADDLMYKSKKAGRNCITMST